MSRRVRVHTEEDRLIPVDEEKLELVFRAHDMTPSKYEREVEKQIAAGEVKVREDLPYVIGDGSFTTEEEQVNVELEELCEKHEIWFPLHPKRTAKCWRCQSEGR